MEVCANRRHYCLQLVAECRILLTFGIWLCVRLTVKQVLAPAADIPGKEGMWVTLCCICLIYLNL